MHIDVYTNDSIYIIYIYKYNDDLEKVVKCNPFLGDDKTTLTITI